MAALGGKAVTQQRACGSQNMASGFWAGARPSDWPEPFALVVFIDGQEISLEQVERCSLRRLNRNE